MRQNTQQSNHLTYSTAFDLTVLKIADVDFSCGQPVNLGFLMYSGFDIVSKDACLQDGNECTFPSLVCYISK